MLPRRKNEKLKYQYHQAIEENGNDCFYFWKRYPNIKSFYFKHFSNKQERSFYFLHSIEYKDYSLRIRVARGAGLPHIWDEFPTYVYKVAKSWKHNSKSGHFYFGETGHFYFGLTYIFRISRIMLILGKLRKPNCNIPTINESSVV